MFILNCYSIITGKIRDYICKPKALNKANIRPVSLFIDSSIQIENIADKPVESTISCSSEPDRLSIDLLENKALAVLLLARQKLLTLQALWSQIC